MWLGPTRPIVLVSGEPPYLLDRLNYLTYSAYAGRFDANPLHLSHAAEGAGWRALPSWLQVAGSATRAADATLQIVGPGAAVPFGASMIYGHFRPRRRRAAWRVSCCRFE
jgi:hypothetical protein